MPDYQYVTDRLALGGAIHTVDNMRELARDGITHVVDMQQEFDDRSIVSDTGIQVLWLDCPDDFLPKPPELFWDGVLFAMEALQAGQGRVLFHCAAGIHRGPMMLLAAMRALGYPLHQAKHLIASARPQVEFPEVYVTSVEDFLLEYQAGMNPAGNHR